jgi:Glycosyltransferase sugar-binding region containing DXD motif
MISSENQAIRYVSYWETALGTFMPPYVALAIVSMQRALGNAFQLLTPQSLPSLIGTDFQLKSWDFEPLAFEMMDGIKSIVAKSDYIRMAYVHQHGGVWLDADTVLFGDPTISLFPVGLTAKLHWHSEALFGSRKGNALLGQALNAALRQKEHTWGDPGGIKAIVAHTPEQLLIIPANILDPGYRPLYNFSTCEVMRSCEVNVDEFITAPNVKLLKLYNTYFTRTSTQQTTVAQFLREGTLLAKLFLHIDSNPSYWIDRTDALMAWCVA